MWLILLLARSVFSEGEKVVADGRIVPGDCDCFDWYGSCKTSGSTWVDEGVWMYNCDGSGQKAASFLGCLASGAHEIPVGDNTTIQGFWHSCTDDERALRYERELSCTANGSAVHVGEEYRDGRFQWLCRDTGRWVTGCYYTNETGHDVLLRVGESGLNGLVRHVCDRWRDAPGRVQYYTQIRDDVHVKHPTNKGESRSLPEPLLNGLEGKVGRWLHENVESFIASDKEELRGRVRYLPPSRRTWGKEPTFDLLP